MLEIAVFMAAYIPLRSFAGGYHAKTPLRCYFTSLTIIFVVLLFCKYVPLNLLLNSGILVISLVVCTFLCPVQDSNKPLDCAERQRYRNISVVILFIEAFVWLIMTFVIHKYAQIIPISIFTEVMMVVIGKVKNNLIQKKS